MLLFSANGVKIVEQMNNYEAKSTMKPVELQPLDDQEGMAPETHVLGPNDVLNGRTKLSFNHIGNRRFRELVAQSVHDYNAAPSRTEKYGIIDAVVAHVVNADGRFLKFNEVTGEWNELEHDVVRQKISHAIRDTTKKKEAKMKRESQRDEAAAKVTKHVKKMISQTQDDRSHDDLKPAVKPASKPAPKPAAIPSSSCYSRADSCGSRASESSKASSSKEALPPISHLMQNLNSYMQENTARRSPPPMSAATREIDNNMEAKLPFSRAYSSSHARTFRDSPGPGSMGDFKLPPGGGNRRSPLDLRSANDGRMDNDYCKRLPGMMGENNRRRSPMTLSDAGIGDFKLSSHGSRNSMRSGPRFALRADVDMEMHPTFVEQRDYPIMRPSGPRYDLRPDNNMVPPPPPPSSSSSMMMMMAEPFEMDHHHPDVNSVAHDDEFLSIINDALGPEEQPESHHL